MTIGGEAAVAESGFAVVNPALGQVFATAPACAAAQLDAAMAAAAHAFVAWRGDLAPRRAALMAAATALQERIGELAPLLTQEQGKPLAKAVDEIAAAVAWLQYTASLDLSVELVEESDLRRIEVRQRPLGVVAAITSWDYPVLLAVWKFAPALLAGNTVVLKPSPFTPLYTLRLGEVLRPVLPSGVLNIVAGGDELGAAMTAHPTVRKISFTGSVAVGKQVAAVAASNLKRITLELGGNDPAIVLPDADPHLAAQKIFLAAFENGGQARGAIKRVYVSEGLYEGVVADLAALARAVRVGNGLDAATQLGPVNNLPQLQRVQALVDDAKARGARVVAGGGPLDRDGYFFAPTIVADVDDGVRLVDEEQFGPALPVLRYRDVGDAIARANASNFGLGASVWGRDLAAATAVAGQLDCGTAWVNQHLVILPHLPFGGTKWSGIGVETGARDLAGCTEVQVVNVWKR